MKPELAKSSLLFFVILLWAQLVIPKEALCASDDNMRLRYWVPKNNYGMLEHPPWKIFQWMDRGHASLSDQIRLSAQSFDGLFGKPNPEQKLNSSTVLSRFGVLKEEGEDPTPLFRFSAKLDLPIMKRRWKLLVNSTTETFFTKRLTGTGDPFRLGEASEDDSQVITTALRWNLIQDVRQILNLDLGVKVRASPKAYLKGNYLKRWSLPLEWKMVFNQHLYGVINDDSGSSTSLDFNKSFGSNRLFRVHHRYTRLFDAHASTWQITQSLYQVLSRKATIALHASVSGEHNNIWQHNDVAFALQYKRNFFRPWIWVFLEPELHHPRTRNWKRTHQITLGFETLFGGK